jgi:diguanylate cyclase (GGDEF)-like protein
VVAGLAGGARALAALGRSAGFAATFLVAVWLGRLSVIAGTALNVVWPAAGIAVVWFAVQARAGTRWLDVTLLTLITVSVDVGTGTSPQLAACFAIANLVQVWVFLRLFGRWCPQLWGAGGTEPLMHVRQMTRMIAAAVLAALTGTVIGSTALWALEREWSWFGTLVWLSRNAVSIIVLAAVGLRLGQLVSARLARPGQRGVRSAARAMVPAVWRRTELVLALCCSAASYVLFFHVLQGYPLAFPLLILTVWVALRFDTTIVVLHDFVAGAAVVLYTLHGDGPFAVIGDEPVRVLMVQAYVGMVAVVGLTLALGRDEREVLLRQVRRQAVETAEHAEHVQALARVSRALFTTDDARAAICAAACEIAGADAAYLLEPEGQGRLVSTAVVGADMPPLSIDLGVIEGTLTAGILKGEDPVFISDVASHPGVSPSYRESLRVASAAWQPVIAHGVQPVGVIALIWHCRVAALPGHVPPMLETLAAEAASAIERGDLLARLAEAADRDPLTGLANRRRWDEAAEMEIARAGRSGAPLTFLLVDLDHFKRYNDTYGHLSGDILLRDFGTAAAGCLREVDTIARWGGEEFVVALPNCATAEATIVADRIRAAVPCGQTCTVGIAQWTPGESAGTVLARADAALYQGKRSGRNISITSTPVLS